MLQKYEKMLTDSFLRSASPGEYRDDGVPGLSIRCGVRKKTWYFVFRAGGRIVRKNLGSFPDVKLRDARKAARIEAGIRLAEPERKSMASITIDEVWERWRVDKGEAKRSALKDEQLWRIHIEPRFGGEMLAKIQKFSIEKMKTEMQGTPVAFNRVRALMTTLFNYANVRLGTGCFNSPQAVEKYPETPRDVFLASEDASSFFRELDSPRTADNARDLIYMTLHSGMRPGEVMALRWADVDMAHGVIAIPAERAKGRREMITPITRKMAEILEKRIGDDRTFVFKNRQTANTGKNNAAGHVTSFRKALLGVCRRAGVREIHPHDLRRTYGMWLLNAGASMEDVSAALHHSSITVTQKVYAKILPERLREGAEKIAQIIEKSKLNQSSGESGISSVDSRRER